MYAKLVALDLVLCHTDDIEYGTPCTWISQNERRAGRVEWVTRHSEGGIIISIAAREFKNDSTRHFSVRQIDENYQQFSFNEPNKRINEAPSSGAFLLLVGYAEPPFIKSNCWHPTDMLKPYRWEHDNGYGVQTTMIGQQCGICGLRNSFPNASNYWFDPYENPD